MTRAEIVEALAKERRVEQIIKVYCPNPVEELKDLAQIVYLALLQKPERMILDLWSQGGIGGAINFYIKAIVKNQVKTGHSTYRDLFTKYQSRVTEITGNERVYESDIWERHSAERGGGALSDKQG